MTSGRQIVSPVRVISVIYDRVVVLRFPVEPGPHRPLCCVVGVPNRGGKFRFKRRKRLPGGGIPLLPSFVIILLSSSHSPPPQTLTCRPYSHYTWDHSRHICWVTLPAIFAVDIAFRQLFPPIVPDVVAAISVRAISLRTYTRKPPRE